MDTEPMQLNISAKGTPVDVINQAKIESDKEKNQGRDIQVVTASGTVQATFKNGVCTQVRT